MNEEHSKSRFGVREPMPGVIYAPAARLRAYVDAGELEQITLAEALGESFRQHADRIALYAPECAISYRELDQITDRFGAALLGIGLRPLDRVLFQAGNSKELIYAVVGCIKAGLIPVCTLAAHREREIGYLGVHTGARAHIVQDDDPRFDLVAFAASMKTQIPSVQHIISLRGRPRALRLEDLIERTGASAARNAVAQVSRDPFQVVIFQLSGGTTGVPKVIPRMQNDYLLNARRTATWLQYEHTDVLFNPMPMIHNACMICFWVPTLLTGAAFVIAADLTPESWSAALRASPPTWVGVIRALLPRLEAVHERELACVRRGWCPDAPALMRQKFGWESYGMFGMSEGLNMYPNPSDPPAVRDWSVGRPISRYDEVRLVVPGTEQDIADGEIGELICRGPYTISGYFDAPDRNQEAFTREGFYRTGDLMTRQRIEGQDFYSFAGRTKDVVCRGQEKISCEEVENALGSHPAISTCAVVGMPDTRLGERICVYVVPRPGVSVPTIGALGEFLRGQGLARFKWPERVETIDVLPVTKVGKVDKARLRTAIAEQLAREAGGADSRGGASHNGADEILTRQRDTMDIPVHGNGSMVTIFVPDIPEFLPLVRGAEAVGGCQVVSPSNGYWRIEMPQRLTFHRKALGLGPALWNSALSGGFCGRVVDYDRDRLCIEAE